MAIIIRIIITAIMIKVEYCKQNTFNNKKKQTNEWQNSFEREQNNKITIMIWKKNQNIKRIY